MVNGTTHLDIDIDKWQSGRGKNLPQATVWSFNDTPFGACWEQLMTVKDGKFAVDGFSFRGRMAVMKYLIAEMDDAFLWGRASGNDAASRSDGKAGHSSREYHWLWGYASQLDWQFRTGRLHFGSVSPLSSPDGDLLAQKSWWSYMNFCFSICILEGAQRAGVTTAPITYDPISQDLIDSDELIQSCIRGWETLFREGYIEYTKSMSSSKTLSDDEFQTIHYMFRKHVWQAHTVVILCGIGTDVRDIKNPKMREMLARLPPPERGFGLGWCRMVELLGICAFPTDMVSLLSDGAGYLPLRIVTDEDYQRFQKDPCGLSSIDKRRFTTVKSCIDLANASLMEIKVSLALFQRVVRTAAISRSMPGRVLGLIHGGLGKKVLEFGSVLFLAVYPRGMVEVCVFCGCLVTLVGIAAALVSVD